MARPWEFQLATRVVFGRGALRQIGSLAGQFGRRAILVGYREPGRLAEVYARAAETMEKAGLSVARLEVVEGEPTVEALGQAAGQVKDLGADVVVGLGGGSVLDMAKGIAAFARRAGGTPAPQVDLTGPIENAVPVLAVPTTAGTGSEVTSVAVYGSPGGPSGVPHKATLNSSRIAPKIALVDPDLALGSPPELTAACGADALGHALEATISRRANPMTSLLAGRAVAMIVGNLPRAVSAPDDPVPREPLALAATLAGAAFNEAGVTVAHALAHALGAVLGVPHAAAVAIATPVSLRYNLPACAAEYAALADTCGLPGGSSQEKAQRFVEEVSNLLRSIGLPDRAVVPPDLSNGLLDRLARSATESLRPALTLNPRKVDAAALRELCAECVAGDPTAS